LQPSTTGLFVTNLPFKFSDEDFAVVFTDAGTKPKSAKVVRNRNGRSKGYGFVEFENNVDQQKALKAVNTKVVAERELVVKVAMIEPQGEQKAEQPKPQQTQTAPQGQKAPAPAQSPAQTPAQTPAQQTSAPKQEVKATPATASPSTTKKEEVKPTEKKPAPTEAKKEPASPGKQQTPPKK
jgi:RNA recognition motif-containing protein